MTTIEIFPNSGHHYAFVPFKPEVLELYPQLATTCAEEKEPWVELNHPWIRGRYGCKEKAPGVWIAVESNLGKFSRGSVYEAKRPQDPKDVKSHTLPYAATDVTRLPETLKAILVQIPLPGLPDKLIPVEEFEIIWKKPAGEAVDVDLVVDFGNTRTVVLALENLDAQEGKLSAVCRSVRFTPPGCEYEAYRGTNAFDDTCAIVDSWFILKEPMFANLEPPLPSFAPIVEVETEEQKIQGGGIFGRTKMITNNFVTKRIPQAFIELSPAVFGDSAREILGNLYLEGGGNFSLSSPKRYCWDTDPIGRDGLQWWTMVLNRWNPRVKDRSSLPKLAGPMLRFLPSNGRVWDIDNPPNEAPDHTQRPSPDPQTPDYPRSEAMTWAALSILELAYRQITSEIWRKGHLEFVPRRLRSVRVTFPSGWSPGESASYQSKWRKALNIFTLSHLEDKRSTHLGGDQPDLVMDLDEAVASQLPFVYSEIRRMGNFGENWIELFGRGNGIKAKIRMMALDIGGGTTDISIVEYGDNLEGGGVDLRAELLFRDSSTVAGDALAKEIIESVLLPSLGAKYQGFPEKLAAFENLFRCALANAGAKAKWSRIVKLVFLPIIRQWLKDLANGSYGNPESEGMAWCAQEIRGAVGTRQVDERSLDDLNRIARDSSLSEDILADSEPIIYNPGDLLVCIDRIFRPVIASLGKYITAFDVDLVTLCGKPSELPSIFNLLEELLPIPAHRIIQAKKYHAGDWYPMSSDNTINDAKSVTVVGAALYQAIHNGRIPDWTITLRGAMRIGESYWGVMPLPIQPHKFSKQILKPGQTEATVQLQVGAKIGRKLLPSAAKPEQIYRMRWKDREAWLKAPQASTLKVTFQRVSAAQPGEVESLRITAVEGVVLARNVRLEDIELQLCTLEEEEFWLDNGRFEVIWK